MAGKDEEKQKKTSSSAADKDKAKDGKKDATKDKVKKAKDNDVTKDKAVKAGSKDKPASSKDKSSGSSKEKSSTSSKDKDAAKSKKEAKENKKDGTAPSGSKKGLQAAAPAPRGPKRELPPKADSYLAMMNLPSSDESEEEVEKRRTVDEEAQQLNLVSSKDNKKIDSRERKLLEKQAAAKADALKDDDNVFDVSYEKQGEGTDTLSATDIKVHNMTIRAKGKLLLENTTVTIAAGRRYGLVGPNGKGKSTLLRMIARRQIPVPENLDVLLVEQEIVGDDRTALEAVVAADFELMELRQQEAEITAKLQAVSLDDTHTNGAEVGPSGEEDEDLAEKLNQIYERMSQIGGASAEARASKILHGLGFTEIMQKRTTQNFSGGWRMRISLARALYIQPTVLLLDEPTNHLDLRAVLWLEEYLQRWKKTLIVVSHDRDFLNSITTDIIHLHDLKLHYYRGNFVQFEEMYDQRRREVNKEYDKYVKQLKAAKKTGSKSKADTVVANAKKSKGKRGARDAVNEDDEGHTEVPKAWSDYQVKFHFPTPTELPPPLIQLIDVDFKYPGRDDFGLQGLNIGVDMGSRIAIVGPNGAGKTTLMNLLSGFLDPTTGDFRKSHKLRIGKYAQHFVDALAMEDTPVEYMLNKFRESGKRAEEFRAILGRFGLSGHHHLQPICKLSGGQKARVVFASLSLEQPHILLLDEPTNHLDMQSIDALSDALEEFDGGVIIISHDSRLLSRVCDDEERAEVWLVEDGQVERYDGDFADYKDELMKEIAAELDKDEAEIAAKNTAGTARRK